VYVHVCKVDSLRVEQSMCTYMHWSVIVILCKSEASKVVESASRRAKKMWNKRTGKVGTGGILETSNRSQSPHTHSETSSICRYTERHEQQRGGRRCVWLHLCSQYHSLVIFTITIQTTILWCVHVLLGRQVHSSHFFVWAKWQCIFS